MKKEVFFGALAGLVAVVGLRSVGIWLPTHQPESSAKSHSAPSQNVDVNPPTEAITTLRQPVSQDEALAANLPAEASKPSLPTDPEFTQLLDKTYASLPRTTDLRRLSSDEAHVTPKALVDAATGLGELLEAGETSSQKRPLVMEFLQRCTSDFELSTALRAVCLSRSIQLVKSWKVGPLADLDSIPPTVLNLASRLMSKDSEALIQ
jgi:hypothetical protein